MCLSPGSASLLHPSKVDTNTSRSGFAEAKWEHESHEYVQVMSRVDVNSEFDQIRRVIHKF